ncbi:AraC family transcriptional regulator [Clostridia bacterium]|nr:AraC family transcriptional regulator [Clostridia bacterium]
MTAEANATLKIMESFAFATGCGIMKITNDSDYVLTYGSSCGCLCAINSASSKIWKAGISSTLYCLGATRYASEQSRRFGGKYIYFCPAGFFFIVCPAGTVSFAAGPMSTSDYDFDDASDSLQIDSLKYDDAKDFNESIPKVEPDTVSHIANMLWVVASYISSGALRTVSPMRDRESAEQQRQIGEYIQNIKASLIKESQGYIAYPYDTEKQLTFAIASGNLADSRKYLNEILGHIFFSSASNLEVIKVRAMELSVMISRAAIDTGADRGKIFNININFLADFFSFTTIEEVCWSLTDILRRFTRETFEFNSVKHVDLISKAVSYVKTNYARKISLQEVADYVFLSPSYFSKIFKDEMKCYFNDYLNNVRVEKSKLMLLTEHVNMLQVAENVGFYDQSYFNKVFKKITGVTPKKYKESGGKVPPKHRGEK